MVLVVVVLVLAVAVQTINMYVITVPEHVRTGACQIQTMAVVKVSRGQWARWARTVTVIGTHQR